MMNLFFSNDGNVQNCSIYSSEKTQNNCENNRRAQIVISMDDEFIKYSVLLDTLPLIE